MNCPTCAKPLQEGRFGEADVKMCPDCLGTLVAQGRLIPLMEDLSKDLMGQIDFDHPIERAEHAAGPLACPKCTAAMEGFGYMETNLVKAWRCNRDWLVWADTEALGVMSVLYARTKTRKQARDAVYEQELESLNNRVVHMLKARMRTRLIGGGIIGIGIG